MEGALTQYQMKHSLRLSAILAWAGIISPAWIWNSPPSPRCGFVVPATMNTLLAKQLYCSKCTGIAMHWLATMYSMQSWWFKSNYYNIISMHWFQWDMCINYWAILYSSLNQTEQNWVQTLNFLWATSKFMQWDSSARIHLSHVIGDMSVATTCTTYSSFIILRRLSKVDSRNPASTEPHFISTAPL